MMRINKENIKNNRTVRYAYYFVNGIVHRKALKKKAEKTIETFGVRFQNPEEREKTIADMLQMNSRYGYGFSEYLYYHFAEKAMPERCSFVADWEHLGYTCAMNDPDNAEIFDNKWITYKTFHPYYRRDVQICKGAEDAQKFQRFLSDHERVVIKPLDASCGHGVKIIDTKADGEISIEKYKVLLKESKGRFIVEEFIDQAEEMSRFHPASVNTVRMPTIRVGETVHIVNPFFRIGQHGNHVDNAGSGGIICAIDAETGIIFAAADEHGKRFEKQPDTEEQIIGYAIPKWNEAKDLVTELAKVIPDNHYTGWDLALREDGWVLVEANRRGQFVWQIASQKGFRAEINHYLKKLGLKY